MQTGNLARTQILYEEALAIMETTFGDIPQTAGYHTSLGCVHELLGRTPKAESHYRAALETYENAMGDDHVDLAQPILDLARFLRKAGADHADAVIKARHFAEADELDARAKKLTN